MTRFAAVLAVFGLLAAAGCGGSQSGSESRDVLRVLAWGTEGSKLDDMAARFTREHPDIDLRITSVTSSAAHEKLLVGIAGGEVPDVAVVGASNMAALAHTHALEKAPAEFDQRQFLPAAIDAVQINGTAYGVPWFLDTRVLFYRTDIAAKAGVTAAPTTWAELKEAARAMQSKSGAKYGISLPTDSWQIFLPFLYQAGADITDGPRVSLNTPEVAAATAYFKSFVDEGLTPSVVREGFEIAPAFVRGTHPMFISGAWQMRRIREVGGPSTDGRWAVAPLPRGRTEASTFGGGIWTVPKGSSHRKTAWEFVKWMSEPAQQAEWYTAVGALPASRAAWSLPALADDPHAQVFRTQLRTAKRPPALPEWPAIAAAIEVRLDALVRMHSDGQEMAEQLDAAANSVGAR